MGTEKGFFGQLFDLSFKSFITLKIIKLLYVLSIIGSVFTGLIFFLVGVIFMKESVGAGFLMIIFAPLIALLGIIWSRVMAELTAVFFTIAENTTKIAEIKEKERSVNS